MRGEIDEVEERVRRDLVSASADLRAQLVIALREFETFHTGVLQASNEAISKATQQVELQIEQVAKVAEAAIKRVDSKIDANDSRTEKLAELLTKISDAIAQLPLMSKVELPNERLQRQILSFTSELELLIMELRNAASKARKQNQSKRRWYWPFRPREQ
jgi:hypothetical protein